MTHERTDLREKVYLVTGGGGGLGTAICAQLYACGAGVVVLDREAGRAQRCAERLSAGSVAGGWPLVYPVHLDVCDAAGVDAALADVVEHCGHIDGVINNAAIDITLPVDEISPQSWLRVLMTNLYGPYLMAHGVVPMLKARGGGDIVNIASTASCRAWPNASAYHASKWGLLGMSHALHAELRPFGIRVSAIIAGGMRTPFLLERFPEIDPAVLQAPEHVAQAVIFALTQPQGSVIPELMVLPMRETSWP